MKIYKRLSLGFLSIILSLSLLGMLLLNSARKKLRQELARNYTLLGSSLMNKVDMAIHGRTEEINIYAGEARMQEELRLSNAAFSKIKNIEEYINKRDWGALPKGTTNPFIDKIANNNLSVALRNIVEFYKEKYGYPIFGEIFVTNRYGANVAQSGQTSDYRQDDEEWWQLAKRDRLYVSNLSYDSSSDVNSIAICVRVDDEKGEFAGVIKAPLNIKETEFIIGETIRQSLSLTGAKEGEIDINLIDRREEIVYSTGEYKIFEDISQGLKSAIRKWKGDKDGRNYTLAPGDKKGERDKLYIFVESKGYLSYKGIGWTLILEGESSRILNPIGTLLLLTLGAGLMATIFIGGYISRSVSKPIVKLGQAMDEVGRGNLDTMIYADDNDEIGRLGLFFNRMVHDLRILKEEGKVKRGELEASEKMLRDKADKLEGFAKLTVDREIKMTEIKNKIEELEKELGKYKKTRSEDS